MKRHLIRWVGLALFLIALGSSNWAHANEDYSSFSLAESDPVDCAGSSTGERFCVGDFVYFDSDSNSGGAGEILRFNGNQAELGYWISENGLPCLGSHSARSNHSVDALSHRVKCKDGICIGDQVNYKTNRGWRSHGKVVYVFENRMLKVKRGLNSYWRSIDEVEKR